MIQFESPHKVFYRQNFVKVKKVVSDTATLQLCIFRWVYIFSLRSGGLNSRDLRVHSSRILLSLVNLLGYVYTALNFAVTSTLAVFAVTGTLAWIRVHSFKKSSYTENLLHEVPWFHEILSAQATFFRINVYTIIYRLSASVELVLAVEE